MLLGPETTALHIHKIPATNVVADGQCQEGCTPRAAVLSEISSEILAILGEIAAVLGELLSERKSGQDDLS
jgi:hypothetical protein